MNNKPPQASDDPPLQAAFRDLAKPLNPSDALEERILAQWRVTCAAPSVNSVGGGVLARLWPPGRRTLMAAALVLTAVALLVYAQRSDPLLEELAQPDVLSEMMLDML